MRLLLFYLNPPDYSKIPINPYGLEIVASYVRKILPGTKIKIMNPFYSDDPAQMVRETVAKFRPHLIGASLRNIDNALVVVDQGVRMKLGTISYVAKAARLLSAVRREAENIPIIVGGCGFTAAPETLMEALGIKLGVYGPGEETMAKLCALVAEKRFDSSLLAARVADFPGLVVRTNSGVVRSPKASTLLSSVCRVDRIDENALHRRFHNPYYYMPVRYSAGCPERCAYCVEHVNMNRVIVRDPALVIREIKDINERYDHYRIWLTASEINFPPKPLMALCREIIRHKLHRKNIFSAFFFGKPMPRDLYLLLKEAGFDHLAFTVSHFDEALLRRNGQLIRKAEFFKTLEVIKKNGAMPFSVGLLLGQPGETKATLDEVFQTVKEMDDMFEPGPCVYYSAGVRVYPGTPLAHYCRTLGMNSEFIFGDDPTIVRPGHESSPLPPLELCRYVQERFSELQLKGSYTIMNAGFTTQSTAEKAIGTLDKALGMMANGNQRQGKALYRQAKSRLLTSEFYQRAFARFEEGA